MQKIIVSLLLSFILTQGFAQQEKSLSTYLSFQVTPALHDQTLGNNPLGMGLGLQTFFNVSSKFKPTAEITGDIYFPHDDVFRMNGDGTAKLEVPSMVNLLAGAEFAPAKNIYVSLVAGPSFINGQTLLAMKPSLGFYFSSKQRWTGNIAYINVFNRGNVVKENFTSVSLAIGVKLF
ncbi:hypothetical protein [Ferruginibacter sp.]|uniref:hypothetical protein n=1 Tax=Ferruginibacter sp. TaxID=1940288 RepID=UPI001993D758|nr:hypothetical protein [Ferruginibacter sp.]MBC7625992.1 hypothetical protein [Ferruginibacter sp.]